jgi:hypothetical protein
MGETRVDLVHLLEDLRDAYPGSLEETIVTEIVANALDSGARNLDITIDPAAATLLAVDDGRGMTRAELTRYHDLATTSKRRGRGIGFAGVGIKLGLLACEDVITETRRGRRHLATHWHLANRSRAPWGWVEPRGTLDGRPNGTAIRLRVSNPLSQLLDPGFVAAVILRGFQPLFEPEFLGILEPYYPEGMTFRIDGRMLVGPIRPSDRVEVVLRAGRQRRPSATGYLARNDHPVPEPDRGLAISTLGKVIRRGWDWIGMTPTDPDRIEGLIEVPALAEALTLNKGDFLRTGDRGAQFLSFRKAIQEVVTTQLAAWGEGPPSRPQRRTRPMERDLDRVLGALADDFPLLTSLVDRQIGGQRRLALAEPGGTEKGGAGGGDQLLMLVREAGDSGGAAPDDAGGDEAAASADADRSGQASGNGGDADGEKPDGTPPEPQVPPETGPPGSRADPTATSRAAVGSLPGARRRRRRATLSLAIRFEARPGDPTLARLVDATVWINDAHPAYRRAVASRSEGYHVAVSVAAALAPLTVEAARTQEFVNTFLARWGEG